jgi:hypothetical protein
MKASVPLADAGTANWTSQLPTHSRMTHVSQSSMWMIMVFGRGIRGRFPRTSLARLIMFWSVTGDPSLLLCVNITTEVILRYQNVAQPDSRTGLALAHVMLNLLMSCE